MRFARVARHAAAALGYLVVLVWVTWPLPRVCAGSIADPVARMGSAGWAAVRDMVFCAWVLAWDTHALVTGPRGLFEANVFYPAPHALAYSEHFLGYLPVALPVQLLAGNAILTLNVVLFASYLASALAMYALVWHWTRSRLAAFGAGLAFAAPGANLQLVGRMYLPLVVLFLERWTEARRTRDLILLGASLVLQSLCTYYMGYAAFLVFGTHVAVLIARGRLSGSGLAAALGAGAAAAGVVAVVSIPYLRLAAAGVIAPVNLVAADVASLRGDFLGPGGRWFPGWIVLAIAAAGAAVRPARAGARAAALVLVAVGVLFALGPWGTIGGHHVPLPYLWLHATVPGFSAVRFPIRLLVVARLGLAALVGLGLVALGTYGRAGTVVSAVAVAMLLWPGRAGAGTPVRPLPVGDDVPAVYRVLAATPGDGALLELPWSGVRGGYRETAYMLFSTYHWKRLLNGYSGYLPPTYAMIASTAERLPDADALQDLVDLVGLRWLIVHGAGAAERSAWAALEHAGALHQLTGSGQDVLFELTLAPRRNLLDRVRTDALRPAATTLLGAPLTPLSSSALQAAWTVRGLPGRVHPAQQIQLGVRVRNTGSATWPGWGVRPDGLVMADFDWIGADTPTPAAAGAAARLSRDVPPGGEAAADAVLRAPSAPGRYTLVARVRQAGADERAGATAPVGATVVAAGGG